MSDEQAAAILADIAEEEDQNGRIRSNMLDTRRALNFLMRGRLLKPAQREDAKQILRNVDALDSHTSFLFDKINFLMDATIGFININQNKRVNQLTVFSVVCMPIKHPGRHGRHVRVLDDDAGHSLAGRLQPVCAGLGPDRLRDLRRSGTSSAAGSGTSEAPSSDGWLQMLCYCNACRWFSRICHLDLGVIPLSLKRWM